MLLDLPTSASSGVPDSLPVPFLKVAHDGLFLIRKVNGSPSGSEAVGMKEYCSPALIDEGGSPEIVGAVLLTGGGPGWETMTSIKKLLNDALTTPSVTVIVMSGVTPMSP